MSLSIKEDEHSDNKSWLRQNSDIVDNTADTFRGMKCTTPAPLAVRDIAVIPKVRRKNHQNGFVTTAISISQKYKSIGAFENTERRQLDKGYH